LYRAGVGPLKADFAVCGRMGDPGPGAAHRFAYGFTVPPVVRLLSPAQQGALPSGLFVFAEAANDGPVISAVKRAETGDGLILRVFNFPFNSNDATIRLKGLSLLSAAETNLLEENLAPLQISDGGFDLTIGPGDVRTVRVHTAPVSVGDDRPVHASEVLLEQNYPNPFNPSTTIRFATPWRSQVTLELYDLLGRSVRVLADEDFAAGVHKRAWDGRDASGNECASGVYYCTLRATSGGSMRRRTITMLLVH
jgi:hypothetical protein